VVAAADKLHAAAAVAKTGHDRIETALRSALAAVDSARSAGFDVTEELALTDTRSTSSASALIRRVEAEALAAELRARAAALMATDQQVATAIGSAVAIWDLNLSTRHTSKPSTSNSRQSPFRRRLDAAMHNQRWRGGPMSRGSKSRTRLRTVMPVPRTERTFQG
jgi:hypothetical protein